MLWVMFFLSLLLECFVAFTSLFHKFFSQCQTGVCQEFNRSIIAPGYLTYLNAVDVARNASQEAHYESGRNLRSPLIGSKEGKKGLMTFRQTILIPRWTAHVLDAHGGGRLRLQTFGCDSRFQ